jgi:hypothetical protein
MIEMRLDLKSDALEVVRAGQSVLQQHSRDAHPSGCDCALCGLHHAIEQYNPR